jgi:hypothetical protein
VYRLRAQRVGVLSARVEHMTSASVISFRTASGSAFVLERDETGCKSNGASAKSQR